MAQRNSAVGAGAGQHPAWSTGYSTTRSGRAPLSCPNVATHGTFELDHLNKRLDNDRGVTAEQAVAVAAPP
jgi:hypothetical protein